MMKLTKNLHTSQTKRYFLKKSHGIMHKTENALILILTGISIALILRLFVIDFLKISGTSMEPALNSGQTIFINKLAYGIVKPNSGEYFFQWGSPKKNNVVIFLHDDKIVVKRCVLIQGDKLEFLMNSDYNRDYCIIIDGKKIPVSKDESENFGTSASVPEGYVFVLGDNYNSSLDSRSYGFVSVRNITGRVMGK